VTSAETIAERSSLGGATDRHDAVSRRLHSAVRALMREARVPGLSIAVVDRDRLLFAAGFGAADVASSRAATPNTAYLWFSMTKTVTATAALRLADEGRLDLDAPAADYLDYLLAPGPRQPTVRQLLTHTAGLANPLPIRWAHRDGTDGPEPEAMLRRLMSRRAYGYPVGRSARYSNLGYLAAGQVITAAAGLPFETYVRQAVLAPAGMTRTGFAYRDVRDHATGYVRSPRLADPLLRRVLPPGVTGSRHGDHLALNKFYVHGAAYGGLVGDVLDAGRFLRLHLADGQVDGQRVLAPVTARTMRTIEHAGKPFDHGIGWFRRPARSADWVEHYGTGAGFWNVMRLYPTRGLGVVVMTNSTTRYDFEPLFALVAGLAW
jgi:CubicO group peptidase (beta-lactamase class C family)